jgi:hypothetical protein
MGHEFIDATSRGVLQYGEFETATTSQELF